MTFVGKILVIVIMAFSLLFLGLSTVVFTTSKNWMVATKAEQKKVDRAARKNCKTPRRHRKRPRRGSRTRR